jgi:hypothetical protein
VGVPFAYLAYFAVESLCLVPEAALEPLCPGGEDPCQTKPIHRAAPGSVVQTNPICPAVLWSVVQTNPIWGGPGGVCRAILRNKANSAGGRGYRRRNVRNKAKLGHPGVSGRRSGGALAGADCAKQTQFTEVHHRGTEIAEAVLDSFRDMLSISFSVASVFPWRVFVRNKANVRLRRAGRGLGAGDRSVVQTNPIPAPMPIRRSALPGGKIVRNKPNFRKFEV